MPTTECREIIVCPECGHKSFTAKAESLVSVNFYIEKNIIYPKTELLDIDDETLADIECANCNTTLSSSLKDLTILLKIARMS